MTHKTVATSNAPEALGPYSQAICAGDFIFCSGQIAIDPNTQELIPGAVVEQTERVLRNLSAVLQEAGVDFSSVVRTEVYLKNMDDFTAMNEVYGRYFNTEPLPARSTVEVSRLPKDVLVEIACTAYNKKAI